VKKLGNYTSDSAHLFYGEDFKSHAIYWVFIYICKIFALKQGSMKSFLLAVTDLEMDRKKNGQPRLEKTQRSGSCSRDKRLSSGPP